VTFVTHPGPQLAAHPNGIENLNSARRRSHEPLCAKLCQDTCDNLSNRTHAVCQILLAHERGEPAVRGRARRRKVEEMACDSLPDRGERIAREFFEHVVQPMNRFFRERPRERRIVARGSRDALDIEKEGRYGYDRLHEDGCRSSDERRHTQKIPGPDVSHRDLPAVAGMHIDTKQTAHHNGQSLGVRFGVHRMTGWEFGDAPTVDQRFDDSGR
jgi:hypothetical protein